MDTSSPSRLLYRLALLAFLLTALLALAFYAYQGTFSRYMADDYCLTVKLRDGENLLAASWQKYLRSSNRFSNLLLVAFTDAFGPRGVALLPGLLIALWVTGLTWLLAQARTALGWRWPKGTVLTLAALLAFLTLYQAPNRFQAVYWRPGAMTYFAPLVFISFLAGFLLWRLRRADEGRLPLGASLFALLAAFLIGGLSETVGALHIGGLTLVLLAASLRARGGRRRAALTLLGATLLGALLALGAMFLSPANALRLDDAPPPSLLGVVVRSLRYALDFLLDTLRTLPLPTLVSLALTALLAYGLFAFWEQPARAETASRPLLLGLVLTPLVMYLLLVAVVAPSAYGQSYPVARARFPARFVMTAALMVEGALLGAFLARLRVPFLRSRPMRAFVLLVLFLLALYPLRAAWRAWAEIPEYRRRAAAWDARHAEILRLTAQGERELTVPQLPGFQGVKELDVYPTHWVNRCAAQYYGVDSIRAIPFDEP